MRTCLVNTYSLYIYARESIWNERLIVKMAQKKKEFLCHLEVKRKKICWIRITGTSKEEI